MAPMLNSLPEKRKFNNKYRVLATPDFICRKRELEELAEKAIYTGNPKHKKNPGDFGLTPPADPRPNVSLCDNAGIFARSAAQELLRQAFLKGLVDRRWAQGEWPRVVWMVHNDIVLQAMYGMQGQYHGFPLDGAEPICEDVKKAWESRK